MRVTRLAARRARHPEPQYVVQDGEQYELASVTWDGALYEFDTGEYFGTCHSPGPGPTAYLDALYELLAGALEAPEDSARDALLDECVRRVRALRELLERLPW